MVELTSGVHLYCPWQRARDKGSEQGRDLLAGRSDAVVGSKQAVFRAVEPSVPRRSMAQAPGRTEIADIWAESSGATFHFQIKPRKKGSRQVYYIQRVMLAAFLPPPPHPASAQTSRILRRRALRNGARTPNAGATGPGDEATAWTSSAHEPLNPCSALPRQRRYPPLDC